MKQVAAQKDHRAHQLVQIPAAAAEPQIQKYSKQKQRLRIIQQHRQQDTAPAFDHTDGKVRHVNG